jgi:DNA-binding NtrC family response regulator
VKILVVDDEAGILLLCKRVLENPDTEVVTASCAEDAIESLSKDMFDLVLADLKMPGMDGMELVRQVRKAHPRAKTAVFTGEPSIDTARVSLKAGAIGYLPKPVDMNELRSFVRLCLRHRWPMRQEPSAR